MRIFISLIHINKIYLQYRIFLNKRKKIFCSDISSYYMHMNLLIKFEDQKFQIPSSLAMKAKRFLFILQQFYLTKHRYFNAKIYYNCIISAY